MDTIDRAQALTELLEKVRAGEAPEYMVIKVGHCPWRGALGDAVACAHASNAYEGSVDAALALLKAVLPGWEAVFNTYRHWARIWDQNDPECPEFEAKSAVSLSRALLIATLTALLAQEQR